MKLVNLGCGQRIHEDWCNLDLQAAVPGVIEHDLRAGLPFDADSCDAVYHSHVLEHLTRTDGRRMLAECYRVLKPGGVIRAVVPDLERIARDYLICLGEAETDPVVRTKVEWMKLEMIDQMVRTRGGGEMLPFTTNEGRAIQGFIRDRLGDEVFVRGKSSRAFRSWRDATRRIRRLLFKVRRLLALTAVTLFMGRDGRTALKEGLFRNSGELHRWMYDRVTLKQLLESVGFVEVTVDRADTSRIPGFSKYQLDSVDGRIRKPDSLFMEAIKPHAKLSGTALAAGSSWEPRASAHSLSGV